MFSVLRSCALVKLYNAVSCTSLWMSSRAVLGVVSWSTCGCRRSKVGASLLSSVDSVPFFCRRGMSARTCVFWQRVKQGWAREQHRVPWRDVLWHQKATNRKTPRCENTRAAWQLFFTARTWAKPHRFDSSVTLLLRRVVQSKTQWHSNVLKLLKLLQKISQASKTFFQLLQITYKTPTK